MEKRIKQVAARGKMMFVYFWLLPIFFVIFGETGGEWVGMYAGDVRTTYFAETIAILLVAVCVPVSLKLFSWVLVKKIDTMAISDALQMYALWSGLRLALLAIPLVAGFLTYYLMMSNTGALCALISLTASLFCLPGEVPMRKELHIDKEEDQTK